jgi:opacity protein-like surface antigen
MRKIVRVFTLALVLAFSLTVSSFAQTGSSSSSTTTNNDDDFHRFTFKAGGGWTPVTGELHDRLQNGGHFLVGAGYNFNRRFGALLEYQLNELGVRDNVVAALSVPAADARIWSITVNPQVKLIQRDRWDVYAIGGVGYYRRTVDLLEPTVAPVLVFDPFFGFVTPVLVPTSSVIGSIRRNGVGLNGGAGFSVKIGGGVSAFAESRFHWADHDVINSTIAPVSFGIRF